MKRTKNTGPKVSYEPEADVLTWELSKKNIHSASEMGNVVIHFTKDDVPVLIEFLEASKFLSRANRAVGKDASPTVRKALALA
ncbi:MAG: DUF2283 domain-containing protein [Patescibacteria group bacterium]